MKADTNQDSQDRIVNIRFSAEEYKRLRTEAQNESRSITGQIRNYMHHGGFPLAKLSRRFWEER